MLQNLSYFCFIIIYTRSLVLSKVLCQNCEAFLPLKSLHPALFIFQISNCFHSMMPNAFDWIGLIVYWRLHVLVRRGNPFLFSQLNQKIQDFSAKVYGIFVETYCSHHKIQNKSYASILNQIMIASVLYLPIFPMQCGKIPQFSEVIDVMNKLQLPFSYFTL